jgi:pimeloyl-ACP methyl ester carboxylesterase
MSLYRLTFRLGALLALILFFLMTSEPAHCQALRNPNITAAPTRFSVVIEGPAAGTAPDVILIPGLASSRDDYAAEAKLLTPNYRLHLIQIAGFSGEAAGPNATGPILAPVVAQLNDYIATNHLQHPAIIAHSLGGLLALMLAQAHPEDVAKLLIIDTLPFYGIVFNPNATVEMVAPQAKIMATTMLQMPADQFAATQPLMAARLVASPEGQKIVAASSIASDRAVFVNAMLEDLQTDLRPQLAAIKTPTTVLYPYSSAQGPEPAVTALYTTGYSTMPNVKLVKIDNSLHFIMFDQPAAFHTAVLSFLQSKP